MVATYIKSAFASSGDVQAVPDADPGNGTVCYDVGYNPRQELAYTDPQATNIIREQDNQILNTVTSNIQKLQQQGNWDFITIADNGGAAYPYAKGDLCRFGDVNYESLEDANLDQNPSTSIKWKISTGPTTYMLEASETIATTGAFVAMPFTELTVGAGEKYNYELDLLVFIASEGGSAFRANTDNAPSITSGLFSMTMIEDQTPQTTRPNIDMSLLSSAATIQPDTALAGKVCLARVSVSGFFDNGSGAPVTVSISVKNNSGFTALRAGTKTIERIK